ncbi:MAG: hypothetical protein E7453_00080 [Ruminococcaceae bacterium]|nr:hypothetical protein [Oscillospiraceae bacterium]
MKERIPQLIIASMVIALLIIFAAVIYPYVAPGEPSMQSPTVPTTPTDPTEPPETEPPVTNPSATEPPETQPPATEPPTEPKPTVPKPTEPPAKPAGPDDKDFVLIMDYIPSAKVALPYATKHNFTGCRIYDFTDAYLRFGTVKKLQKVSDALQKQGIGLIIWDGFRPVTAQQKLWDVFPDPNYVSSPTTGRRTHCRGNTVDISLYDLETGKELTMPTEFDNFTPLADRDYSDCSPEAAENAQLLEQLMEKHGFKPYFGEWWHFEDSKGYPIEENFDPVIPRYWTPNCNEFIGMWDASGKVFARIPKGETMQLLSWDYTSARVSYNGMTGYVATNYIMPADPDFFKKSLSTVTPANMYTYDQMLEDIKLLEQKYPGLMEVSSIGTSELGRDIPVIRIGKADAKYNVLLQGAIHGREHMTAWLLMAMTDYWLERDILSYGDVCYHIIPMMNPDGVTISQTGKLSDMQNEIYQSDRKNGFASNNKTSYATDWKANGLGVDLNRNFPSGWEGVADRNGPSAQKYKGEKPFSAAETTALRDYTLLYDFDATVSYHSSGDLIYYSYGNKKGVNDASKAFAKAVRTVSGYILAADNGGSAAGYKDWAMDELEIPSITIEIGRTDSPLAMREIYSVFARNCRVLPAIARWLQA